jgi:NTP pyrophosphatase (non-canonical NTP hydrolase)
MTLTQYQQEAKRTCPSLGSLERDLLHMRLGVFTEVGEILDIFKKHIAYGKPIDFVHLNEEGADIMWYLANEMRLRGIILSEELIYKSTKYENGYPTIEEAAADLSDWLCNYSDLYEDTESIEALHYILSSLPNSDFFGSLERNINKLRIRYPEKFTSEHALNRDLEAERKALEK